MKDGLFESQCGVPDWVQGGPVWQVARMLGRAESERSAARSRGRRILAAWPDLRTLRGRWDEATQAPRQSMSAIEDALAVGSCAPRPLMNTGQKSPKAIRLTSVRPTLLRVGACEQVGGVVGRTFR